MIDQVDFFCKSAVYFAVLKFEFIIHALANSQGSTVAEGGH